MKASTRLRKLLESSNTEYILEAHNALSATIAESSGAKGLWASSLTLSASYGLRDNSEMTMTQVLDVLESMTERVEVPILFDGDTGYGQFSHFQQLVRKLCAREIAGVCIEDKIFPKTNSFLQSEQQQLAPVDEFCGKIRAGKDIQPDPDFVVVARTEALITGLDMSAALERAERYAEAGADAILIHSKAPTFNEVHEFMTQWNRSVPVICVPTTYYSTPEEAYDRAGISLVIWANHLLRAAVAAMQRVANQISTSGTARGVEDEIVPVKELFRLQDTEGLSESERVYGQVSPWRAILLAATRGSGLDDLTRDRPKCMIPISGVPAIEKQLQHMRAEGIRDIAVVRGYAPEAMTTEGVQFFDNPNWQETGELGSLATARPFLKGDVVIAYGDILYKRYILHELMASDAPVTVVVDGSRAFLESDQTGDLVRVSQPPPEGYDENDYRLVGIGSSISRDDAHGEWIGLARLRGEGTPWFSDTLEEILSESGGIECDMATALHRMALEGRIPIRVIYIQRDWIDINSVADVARGNTN
ncbi:phosphoenolpyruvate mutase [Myxococcota bacterium]|nr:phosphoenolpyruvate mutase [Myxococcota bacterium]